MKVSMNQLYYIVLLINVQLSWEEFRSTILHAHVRIFVLLELKTTIKMQINLIEIGNYK